MGNGSRVDSSAVRERHVSQRHQRNLDVGLGQDHRIVRDEDRPAAGQAMLLDHRMIGIEAEEDH